MAFLEYILLRNIRSEPYFFWCRLIIGLLIALSLHYYGAVDPQKVILEIESRQILLVLLTIVLCALMALAHYIKPQSRYVRSFRKIAVEFCKASLMVIRGALIMGLAVILYCMIGEFNFSLFLTFANFLLALEFATSTSSSLGSFKPVPVSKYDEKEEQDPPL